MRPATSGPRWAAAGVRATCRRGVRLARLPRHRGPACRRSAPGRVRRHAGHADGTRHGGGSHEALGCPRDGTREGGVRDLPHRVTAVYGTGTTPRATVIAWNATGHGAGADVSTAFAGYQQATGQPVTGITAAATGKLGGRMSCGSGVVGTAPASVCFWADDATFGAVTVLRPTDAKAGAATAVAIRTAMETRS